MPATRLGLSCLALAALLLAPHLGGQAAEPAPVAVEAEPPPSVEQIHDELRALRAAMETALNHRDVDGLLAHVTPDVVFTTMNGDVARGAQGIRDYFARMMEGDDRVVEKVTTHFVADDLSILYGTDLAIAFGHSDDHYELIDGKVFDIAARWTATLVRQEGRWRIAAFHYSTNLFDNPVLEAQRSVLIEIALGAIVVAFLIALFVGHKLGRRAARGSMQG